MKERVISSLVGLAVGDAVGTTLEFKAPGTFKPITDMVGGGPFKLGAGEWTDDTSMALCLAHSLLETESFNPMDQMNRYCKWYLDGYMSSTGECFDIGGAVKSALLSYLTTKEPYSGSADSSSSGNGSLMRLAPIAMYYHNNFDDCIKYAGESSRTTHGSEECVDCCKYFSNLLYCSYRANSKAQILEKSKYRPVTDKVREIDRGDYLAKEKTNIIGSGYVIQSLEAALWCFFNTNTFREAILTAANLGDDADTTAAICGQISGAYYGLSEIPMTWRDKLHMIEEIQELGSNLFEKSANKSL